MKNIKLIIPMLILLSCANTVHDYEYNKAIELCESHGGVRYVKVFDNGSPSCRCNDGTMHNVVIK